jgi:hypothetical protein
MRAKRNFSFGLTERAPWTKPPDCLYQFSSAAETTMPSVPVFVVFGELYGRGHV